MIKLTDNGLYCSKGDVFNLLVIPTPWDSEAVYTCSITSSTESVELTCSLFRGKYVRLYSEALNLRAGSYMLTLKKNNVKVMEKFLIVEEVAHNE